MPPFDDPALKAALRRAIGHPPAPKGLRARVVAALDEVESPASRSLFVFRSPLMGLAVAATILIVAAISATFLLSHREDEKPLIAVLPRSIAEEMTQRHEALAAAIDQSSPAISQGDLAEQAKALSAQVGRSVLVNSPGPDWTARKLDAPVLSSSKTGQILFTHKNKSVSVFSIPAEKVYSPPDGATYDMSLNGHAIAGFVKDRTMYCVVGDSQVSREELKAMSAQLAR